MSYEWVIELPGKRKRGGAKKQDVTKPSKRGKYLSRRVLRPFEYTNTRTITYETYRLAIDTPTGTDPDLDPDQDYYFNHHTSPSAFIGPSGFTDQLIFWWFGNIDGTQLSGGAEDNVYDLTVNWRFTQENTLTEPEPGIARRTTVWTWEWTGTPGVDNSGTTTSIVDNGFIVIETPDFSDLITTISADETHAMTFSFPPPSLSTPTDISLGFFEEEGSFVIEPIWTEYERTLTYHIIRPQGTPIAQWDDNGHPGVTVLGNNIQGEETFYGGAGFDPEMRGGMPKPDEWTAQIQDEADELIALLEAEPHIRSVSESDISIEFEWL